MDSVENLQGVFRTPGPSLGVLRGFNDVTRNVQVPGMEPTPGVGIPQNGTHDPADTLERLTDFPIGVTDSRVHDQQFTEHVPYYDPNGRFLGYVSRSDAYAKFETTSRTGKSHTFGVPTVYLFLVNKAGEMYVIQRANTSTNPFLWDKLGEHVKAIGQIDRLWRVNWRSETYDDALYRGAKEELGLDVYISRAENFADNARRFSTYEKAIVRPIAQLPWWPSIRLKRDGSTHTAIHIPQLYAGVFDGKLHFRDGEVKDLWLANKHQLAERIRNESQRFTYDLRMLNEQYGDRIFDETLSLLPR